MKLDLHTTKGWFPIIRCYEFFFCWDTSTLRNDKLPFFMFQWKYILTWYIWDMYQILKDVQLIPIKQKYNQQILCKFLVSPKGYLRESKQCDFVAMGLPFLPIIVKTFYQLNGLSNALLNSKYFFTEDMLMIFLFSLNKLSISQNFMYIYVILIYLLN